jgi:hypothetical protein
MTLFIIVWKYTFLFHNNNNTRKSPTYKKKKTETHQNKAVIGYLALHSKNDDWM